MSIPPRLYKYHPYSSYALESMVQKKIWVSKPAQFNDPFDCKLRFKDVTTPQQQEVLNRAIHQVINPDPSNPDREWRWKLHQYDGSELDKLRLKMSGKQQLEILTHVGVYSLSSKRDDLLMWAHYADHHKGFVVGFDSSELQQSPRLQLVEVEYVDDYVEVDIDAIAEFDAIATLLRWVAMHKGRRWKEECEWRLVYAWPSGGSLSTMPMPITEVIFGHRMDTSHQLTLRKIVSDNFSEVRFFIAEPSDSAFQLDIVSC